MLSILLTILKILLFTVLGILGLVLLLLLIILFAPVKYKAHVEYHDKACVNAKVRFLFVSVVAHFYQETKDFGYKIKIFGIPLGFGKPKKDKPPKKKKDKSKKDRSKKQEVQEDADLLEDDTLLANDELLADANLQDVEEATAESGDDIKASESSETADSETAEFAETADSETAESDADSDEESIPSEDELDEILKEKPSLKERIISFLEGIKSKATKVGDKLSDFDPDEYLENLESKLEKKFSKARRKINQFQKFINLKCTKKTIKYLKRYLKGALKRLLPRKVKGYVKFGLENPATMGKVVGYLSLMPWTYGSKHFYIEPHFNEKIIDADIKLKGHFNLAYFVKIVFNINLWRTLKVLKKITGGN